jgi:hypothetical protein
MSKVGIKILLLFILFAFCALSFALAEEGPPYVYSFPRSPAEWGQAVSFENLSPGFFQVMYQNKTGVVRIATYGIVGASMDNLKDPQLMMVFAFDQKAEVGKKFDRRRLAFINHVK